MLDDPGPGSLTVRIIDCRIALEIRNIQYLSFKTHTAVLERAKAEGARRAPEWFIEGRKAELEVVAAYNQQILKRWIQRVKPHLEKEKAIIPKMISYLRELETVRGEDEMTNEYVAAQLQGDDCVKLFFHRYYAWLEFIGSAPLIQTPPTLEGKRFTNIDTPYYH